MRIVYLGKKDLLKTIRRHYDDIRVVKCLSDFFTEPSAYHLVDGQLFDDKDRVFLSRIVPYVTSCREIKVHVLWNPYGCKGIDSIVSLRKLGTVDHLLYLDSPVPFERQIQIVCDFENN
jgi:hypothetical protein